MRSHWLSMVCLLALAGAATANDHNIPTAVKVEKRFNTVYIAGSTTDDLGGNGAGHTDVWLARYTPRGVRLWIRQFGGDSSDAVTCMAVDGAGNAYLAGHTLGAFDPAVVNAGGHDAWVAKFNPAGQRLWVRHIGSGAGDSAEAIAVDVAGNIYVAGQTSGALQQHAGGADAWLARLTTQGRLLWIRQIGGAGDDMAFGVGVMPDGSAVVAGYTETAIAGALAGRRDAWIARFGTLGQPIWARQFGGARDDVPAAVTIDGKGNIHVGGYTDGALAGPRDRADYDAWIARFTPTGTRQWLQQYGTPLDEFGLALAIEPQSILAAGYGEFENGLTDAWLARWAPNGVQAGALKLASDEAEDLLAIDTDAEGAIYAALERSESEDGVHGERKALLVKFAPTGNILWSRDLDDGAAARPAPRRRSVPVPSLSYVIAPAATDPAIATYNSSHLVYAAGPTSLNGRLVVFLPGSFGAPKDYQSLLRVWANLGYHTIGLTYPNGWTVNQLCQTRGAVEPLCFDNVRGEIFTGVNLSTLVQVSAADSISNRLYKLLVYLHDQHPDQGWNTWFDAVHHTVIWTSIVVAGHSQGGGHAGFIAKKHAVGRAVMISSPEDEYNNGLTPAWLLAAGATPAARFYGFGHINDSFYARNRANWKVLGLDAFGGLTSVDSVAFPFANSRQLITSLPPAGGRSTGTKCHDSPATDQATPVKSGTPVYSLRQVWPYLVNPD